jgi:anti-anti-sigma factor
MNSQLSYRDAVAEAAETRMVVRFTGSRVCLDQDTVECVRHQLLDLVETPGAQELVLDFGNVHFVASLALGTLILMHKRLAAAGRHLTLCNLRPQVREVFATTCLDKLLNVKPDGWPVDAAPEDLQGYSPPGVLVVDDDNEALHALGGALRARGFLVWLATHGRQAVELFRRNQRDIALVILDALMPGMDGPETLAAMRRISAAVLCCFTTSRCHAFTDSLLLRLGAIRVFRQPFAVAEVERTLFQLASRSSQRGEVRWIEIPTPGE